MNFIGNRVLRGPLLREPLMSPMILSLPTIAGAHLASTRGFIQRGVLEGWNGRVGGVQHFGTVQQAGSANLVIF